MGSYISPICLSESVPSPREPPRTRHLNKKSITPIFSVKIITFRVGSLLMVLNTRGGGVQAGCQHLRPPLLLQLGGVDFLHLRQRQTLQDFPLRGRFCSPEQSDLRSLREPED